MKYLAAAIVFFTMLFQLNVTAQDNNDEKNDPLSEKTFTGMKFRGIGPGLSSGRVSDLAVWEPEPNYFFAAAASGGVWKTTTGGTTWQPVFDDQGSYSIGCVEIDPNNKHVVWVGTGENNSQRSVSWGDGVYKSIDGGKSWKNMGLKESEHIGKIVIDPRNSNNVYAAAQGPLWGPGGDRGLFKTTDAGKNWERILHISKHTGISDIVYDPRDPDVMYCASYQRRRHVWTLINGGPETKIFKTTDAGQTWDTLKSGLPSGNVGRIGLAISHANPDYVYAIIELPENKGGFYRTTDRGASWNKMSDYVSSSPQYYQEIFCDPKDPDKVFSMSTFSKYTEDGGKSWKRLSLKEKHVDDHAFWIDPNNTDHLLIGSDGGIYETYNHGKVWHFFPNLPVTQFYRIGIDNAKPFYHVYGGTQDNATIGGPVQTVSANGLTNCDFFFTKGGDGFQSRVDPKNPNIVYSQAQYGSLVRYDKQSGQRTDIKPAADSGEILKWNWDSPLIISPHSHTRLYFAANKVFRSDDRGNSWTKISGDLSKQIDRNELEVMGKIWSPEAVSKNRSTSEYGNIVALSESPLKEGLLYAGTDDGLIRVTEDGGDNWRKISNFPGVPELAYVSDVVASRYDTNTVYATFDNHKMADFKPYVLKSTDRGRTWQSISGNLPEHHPVWAILEDHEREDLLFVGTEYGAFFSINGGKKWIQLKGGIPTIAVRDMEIQEREDDLCLATFGRGFYILHNYEPIRETTDEILDKEAHMFSIKDGLMYIPDRSKGRHAMGENFYRVKNPFGAVFTYYLKEKPKTLKEKRKEKEKEMREKGKTPEYPSWERLREEDLEQAPFLMFEIQSTDGYPIRKLKAPAKPGINRISWDFDYPEHMPFGENADINKKSGYPVLPGEYQVTMYLNKDGDLSKLAGPVKFNCKLLENVTLPAEDKQELVDFQNKMKVLLADVYGADEYLKFLNKKIDKIKKATKVVSGASQQLMEKPGDIELELAEIKKMIHGDESIAQRSGSQPPSLMRRLNRTAYYMLLNSSSPTETNRKNYGIITDKFQTIVDRLQQITEQNIKPLEEELNELNAPYTPGRMPEWQPE